jgi:hypothetical protein
MANFPLLMPLLAADFAPAPWFCHTFLRESNPGPPGQLKIALFIKLSV